jgi:hypothetical protein
MPGSWRRARGRPGGARCDGGAQQAAPLPTIMEGAANCGRRARQASPQRKREQAPALQSGLGGAERGPEGEADRRCGSRSALRWRGAASSAPTDDHRVRGELRKAGEASLAPEKAGASSRTPKWAGRCGAGFGGRGRKAMRFAERVAMEGRSKQRPYRRSWSERRIAEGGRGKPRPRESGSKLPHSKVGWALRSGFVGGGAKSRSGTRGAGAG